MEEFIVARRKVEECDRCALGYQLVALSACILRNPLDIEICLEIAHSPSGDDFYEALQEELEKLVPATI